MPHVLDRLKGICNFLSFKYTTGSQVYIASHILSELKDICNLLNL